MAHEETKNELQRAANNYPENDRAGDAFLVSAQRILELNQAKILLDILEDPRHHQLLAFVGWDLAKMVFHFLPDDCLHSSETLKSLLNLICSSCNPREICLSLGELLARKISWQQLVILLRLLRQTCNRLEGKISKILSNILSSAQRSLRNRSDAFDQQAEILESTLKFVETIIEKTRQSRPDAKTSEDVKQLEKSVLAFLIALLEHPLSLLEFRMVSEEQTPSANVTRSFKFAETVVGFLGILENKSLKRLLDYGNLHKNKIQRPLSVIDDEDTTSCLSFIGLGCLAFLTHVLNIGTAFFPSVTTARYTLDTTMVYINAMLCSNEAKVISKGLNLLLAILNMVEENALEHNYIDNEELLKLVLSLKNLMLHREDSRTRQESVKGFRKVLGSFTPRGKYRLLRFLYQGEIQSGFAELLNLLLKDEISKSLQTSEQDTWFLGSSVASFLLHDVFKVPSRALQSEFGVIEENNRVLSALNLLRFLVLSRRREQNDNTYNFFRHRANLPQTT